MSHFVCTAYVACAGLDHAPAEPGGPWSLTFALGQLENLRFFIQIICWVP